MAVKISIADFLRSVGDLAKTIRDRYSEGKENDAKQTETAVTADSEEKKKLKDQLAAYDKAYKDSPYLTFHGYRVAKGQPRQTEEIDEEEIARAAREKVSAETEKKKEKAENSARIEEKDLTATAEAEKERAEETERSLLAAAENAKNAAKSDLLKRGLGRSSIAAEELNELDKAALTAAGETRKNSRKRLASIDEELKTLKEELARVLEEYDASAEKEIAKEIETATEAKKKENREAEEYNDALYADLAKQLNTVAGKGYSTDEKDSDEAVALRSDKIRALYGYYSGLGEKGKKEFAADKDFVRGQIGEDGYRFLFRQLYE